MRNEQLNISGTYTWNVIDLASGDIVRSGESRNLIVDVGKDALAVDLAGGTDITIDTIKIGTGTTTFTAASTDLTTEIESKIATVNSSGNQVSAAALFTFASSYQIEEAGLFAGGVAFSLTNGISEDVNSTQGLSILWTITLG